MESSLSSEAVSYALSHLQLSSIRLKEQQRATTEHVKVEITCLHGCQQVSTRVVELPFLLDHKLGKCDHESCGSVVIVISPLVLYTAAYFSVYVSGLA